MKEKVKIAYEHCPFFSIVLPSYNRVKFIQQAIQSVIDQTFTNWELLIIDDASTDGTLKVLEKYSQHSKIVILCNSKNMERSYSRNRGIQLAKGTFICFLDSDDFYYKNHLQVLYNRIRRENFYPAMYYTTCRRLYLGKEKKSQILERPVQKNQVEGVIEYHIPTPCTAIHRTIFKKYMFNEQFFINEDVELFARIALEYQLIYIPVVTAAWVIHSNNTNKLLENPIRLQFFVTKSIFKNPVFANIITKKFKKKKMAKLYFNLSMLYTSQRELIKAIFYSFFVFYYAPFSKIWVRNTKIIIRGIYE